MCGINGIISRSKKDLQQLEALVLKMNDLIIHRGPDDAGNHVETLSDATVGMGMQRLSIIDLSTGNQPMYSDDDQIVLVFNGEIYNYRELKSDLQKEHKTVFKTTSDTEVILKGYEIYGPECFKQLDGMFGLSLLDKNKGKIYLARDYFGEKPLYYHHSEDGLIWASELKSLINALGSKPPISKLALNLYFRLTYIPAPYSIYEGIRKLKPNTYLEYDVVSGTLQENQIEPFPSTTEKDISFDEAKKSTRDLVTKSVISRSVSDVPIGTFLSGGVDSSIVSYCLAEHSANKINTFSIGFEKKSYDETEKSRLVAKMINSNHHEFIIDASAMKASVAEILLNFDEPFADSSALPTYLVSNKTSQHLKVALTGDGGDEIFGGYNKYYAGKFNARYTRVVPKFAHQAVKGLTAPFLKTRRDSRGFRNKSRRMLDAISYKDDFYWDIISLGMNGSDIEKFMQQAYRVNDPFSFYKETLELAKPKSLNDFQQIFFI